MESHIILGITVILFLIAWGAFWYKNERRRIIKAKEKKRLNEEFLSIKDEIHNQYYYCEALKYYEWSKGVRQEQEKRQIRLQQEYDNRHSDYVMD